MDRYAQISKHLNDAGSSAGITFKNDRKVYNTMKAHIIMEWCKQKHPDKSDALMEELFKANFEQGSDISSETVLSECLQHANIPVTALSTIIQDDQYTTAVNEKCTLAVNRLRVSGVPHFIVENTEKKNTRPLSLSGAQVCLLN